MSEPYAVKPDREFLHRLLDEGGEDLKKCFQCATCSVVCELSNERKPFPRKEMVWAQWGLKDRLVADPDVWLCHQCSDCSTRCPRGSTHVWRTGLYDLSSGQVPQAPSMRSKPSSQTQMPLPTWISLGPHAIGTSSDPVPVSEGA